jgi:hypothetical protein
MARRAALSSALIAQDRCSHGHQLFALTAAKVQAREPAREIRTAEQRNHELFKARLAVDQLGFPPSDIQSPSCGSTMRAKA